MKKQGILKRFTPYMGKKKALIPLALVLSGISSVLTAFPFVLIWLMVRNILEKSSVFNFDNILGYAIWIGISSVLGVIVYFIALMSSHLAAFRGEVGIQKKSMEILLNKPLGFFDMFESGKLRKVINEGAATTHNFLAHQLADLSGSIVSLIFILVSMFVVDWRMGLVSMIPLVLGIWTMMSMMGSEYNEFMALYTREMDKISNQAIEYVRGIPVVKTFGGSVFSFKKFYDSIIKYRDFALKYLLLWKNKNSFFTIILQSATVFLAPIFVFILTSEGDTEVLLSNYIFYLLVLPNFIMIIMRSALFQRNSKHAEAALDRIEDVLNFENLVYPEKSKPLTTYDIEFKNVVFAYPGSDTNAVDGVSFTVKEGERVALVGASGSGKTTIARLAVRFWDVKSGEILIGGENIKDVSRENLMQNVAFVFQNTKLFNKSIRENICIGNKDATELEIKKAIDLSMSGEIIDSLENGLETVIGTEGIYLSGGEQQRISLARAILKDAPIVILDEATAFADPENEDKIQAGLKRLSHNKTTLMIVHRLSSIRDVDKILVIFDGKIIESGNHEELISKNGAYSKMYREYQSSLDWQLKTGNNDGGDRV